MLKKTIRRLGALAMVLAMAVSVFAVNASAVEGEQTPEAKKFYIKKTVSVTGENVLAPNTTFSYSVANGTVKANAEGDTIAVPGSGSVYVKNGVNAGKIHIADSVFTPGTTASTKYEAQNEVTFDAGTFTAPGIYYYTVSENSGSYDGITYDNSTLKMYVYVVNDESATPASYKVDGIVVTKSGTTKGEGFDNKYEVDKNNDGKLVLTKEVTGTQGDKNAPWTFKIKIAGPAGEKYLTSVGGTVIDANAQTATEVTLKHRQTFTIYGLSAGDKVEIVEDKANTEGYTTTYATAGKDQLYGDAVNYTSKVEVTGSAYVKVINEKDIATPGGVIMTIAPYALMLVVAGAFAVVFLTRRNRAE